MAAVTVGTEHEHLVAGARAAIAQWEADIAEIRSSIASGQVPQAEIYTLECIVNDRLGRIAQLQRLI